MRKKLALLAAATVSLGLLASCGSTSVTESTIELKKNGKLVEYTISSFAQSYYDADEFKTFVNEEVETFLADNEGSVKVSKCSVAEEVASLTITYDSAQTYASFTGILCFSGSIVQAQTEGYDFSQVYFVDANADSSDSLSAEAEDGYIPGSELMDNDDFSVLIVQANVDVIVPGTIQYVSAENTQISGKNTVICTAGEDEADTLIYILYQ